MPQAASSSRLVSWRWALLALLATLVGLASLRYALPKVPFPAGLPNFQLRHKWLIAHAIFASIALLTGPWQFLPLIRQRWLPMHRWIGRIYCGAVLLGWLASLPIAAHAQAGAISSAGFLTLGFLWVGSTAAGYFTIRSGKVIAHRRWMIRSFALTAAAITLRIYLPLLPLTGLSFSTSYRIIAWACWVPNLFFAEWLLRHQPTPEPIAHLLHGHQSVSAD
ncbi:DUF2306 domain-containing protein [Tunturiibacter gelidiferens]|uniref:DUF2306 domain-containing protein n=1 Tax=Tunturiibacter gelidiferens TaxID=3069689 RepID=A0AAU7Z6U1_9BACT